MPIYGYECLDCGHGFEIVQKMTDANLTKCEACGGVLKKKIFPVGVVFKGSGFYVNDYASKGGAKEESAPVTNETKPAESTPAPAATAETPAKPTEPAASVPTSVATAPAATKT
jgi:putative FmdB family regulatory protein